MEILMKKMKIGKLNQKEMRVTIHNKEKKIKIYQRKRKMFLIVSKTTKKMNHANFMQKKFS